METWGTQRLSGTWDKYSDTKIFIILHKLLWALDVYLNRIFTLGPREQGWLDEYEEVPLVSVKDLISNLEAVRNSLGPEIAEKRSMGF